MLKKKFMELYLAEKDSAASLVAVIDDLVKKMNIKLEHCVGQCYVGACKMQAVNLLNLFFGSHAM